MTQAFYRFISISIIMIKNTISELAVKLDRVQQGIWIIEEGVVKNLGSIAKQKADIDEIKSLLDIVNEKLDKLDIEISVLRSNNGN